MKHVRMDLFCFEGSFGVEKKNLHSLFPRPPVLKKLTQETFCRLELCTLVFWGSLRGPGHAELGLDGNWSSPCWEGGGEQLAGLVSLQIVSLQPL